MIERITREEFLALSEYVYRKVTESGKAPLSLAVTDEASNLVYMDTMDGSHYRSSTIAAAKSAAASRMGWTSEHLLEVATKKGFALGDYVYKDMSMMPGGAPIIDDDGSVIGGIGISGWAAAEDQVLASECADMIIKYRHDRLKGEQV